MDDYRVEICTVETDGRETPAPYNLPIDQRGEADRSTGVHYWIEIEGDCKSRH